MLSNSPNSEGRLLSYLRHVSFIPMSTESTSGWRSRQSVCQRSRRSLTLFPLMPRSKKSIWNTSTESDPSVRN